MMKFLILPLFAATAGCASLGTKFDAQKAKGVKRVALLSVEILQEQPKDALGFAKAGELKHGRMAESDDLRAMSTNVFREVAGQLKSKTGWDVVELDTMVGHPAYRALHQKMETGLRTVTMTGKDTEIVPVPGVLSNASFRKLSHGEKLKLARAMGADAYAEFVVIQDIHQGFSIGNLTGDAAFSFTSRAGLRMFTAASEEPVWQIQNVEGEKSPDSETVEGPKAVKLARIGELSAQSSIRKLVGTYKQ